MQPHKFKPVSKVEDPYKETDVNYLIVDSDTMKPDIVEVDKGTPGSYATLQEAKSAVMSALREKIAEGMESLDSVRQIGIEIKRLM